MSRVLPHTAVNEQDQSMQLAFQQFLQVLSAPPSEQQKQQIIHILQSNPRLVAIFLNKRQQLQTEQTLQEDMLKFFKDLSLRNPIYCFLFSSPFFLCFVITNV
ncbi:hypothetical protein B4U80_14320 [Leptotrombidium deliense]|uniref:Nuclear receptor coactivator CREB-bp-like interlocking domain-containing protein n=1 Tax=Leptotrombidium deliense TaxID=299467 RepID=A0A443RXQ1_9ACAR|nr:hypothetical protein B4U80_14320 [Leptotrombidium deliense]